MKHRFKYQRLLCWKSVVYCIAYYRLHLGQPAVNAALARLKRFIPLPFADAGMHWELSR